MQSLRDMVCRDVIYRVRRTITPLIHKRIYILIKVKV